MHIFSIVVRKYLIEILESRRKKKKKNSELDSNWGTKISNRVCYRKETLTWTLRLIFLKLLECGVLWLLYTYINYTVSTRKHSPCKIFQPHKYISFPNISCLNSETFQFYRTSFLEHFISKYWNISVSRSALKFQSIPCFRNF